MGGTLGGTATLPDGFEVDESDGVGLIVHVDAQANTQWVIQLPVPLRLEASGDSILLQARVPEDTGFEIDGTRYPPTPAQRTLLFAKLSRDGVFDWVHRVQTPAAIGGALFSRPGGGAYAAINSVGDEVWVDAQPSPPTSGSARLVGLDAQGRFDWEAESLPLAVNSDNDIFWRATVAGSQGVIWSVLEACTEHEHVITPRWGDEVVLPACDSSSGVFAASSFLMGYTRDTGSLAYAHPVAAHARVTHAQRLSDGAILLAMNYGEPATLLPSTAEETPLDRLVDQHSLNSALLVLE